MEIYEMNLRQLIEARDEGKLSSEEIIDGFIKRIDAVDDDVKGFVSRLVDGAEVEVKDIGDLRGIPIAVKDNMATLEFPTSCSSKLLEGYTTPYEGTVVKKLKEAGAVIDREDKYG